MSKTIGPFTFENDTDDETELQPEMRSDTSNPIKKKGPFTFENDTDDETELQPEMRSDTSNPIKKKGPFTFENDTDDETELQPHTEIQPNTEIQPEMPEQLPLNIMLIGHGQLMLTPQNYIQEFTNTKTTVFTFAAPFTGCHYPPSSLDKLRVALNIRNIDITNFETFKNVIQEEEKKILGINYCDKGWVDSFNYGNLTTHKSCGIQTNTIQNKLYSFYDEEYPDVCGIWNLEDNNNMTMIIPPIKCNRGQNCYLLSDIITFLREQFPERQLNILDCTCSIVFGNVDPRAQRRAQRGIRTGGNKTKNTKKKHKQRKTMKKKHKQRKTMKKYHNHK